MTIGVEEYGRYTIKSGPLRGAWAANAFRGKTRVAQASAETRAAAVAAVKAELARLDALDQAACDADGAPAAARFEAALAAILPDLPDGYRAMLRAHLAAPDQLLSATRLAAAAGYENYNAANLHYGFLGKRVADEIGYTPRQRRADGSVIWTCAIARGADTGDDVPAVALERSIDNGHYQWQLRPQMVRALRALGW